MDITFILSAHNRSMHFQCMLSSLLVQQGTFEIIVTDNSNDLIEKDRHKSISAAHGIRYVDTASMGSQNAYQSANMVYKQANGTWLGFPSDDGYYVPHFSSIMLEAAKRRNWDLVYCDILYHSANLPLYSVLRVGPLVNHIDKTCYLIKRDKFNGFPLNDVQRDDGHLIESLLSQGILHGKAPGILVVHN